MCGIFGAIGNYNIDKVKLLAVLNESRGNHATGLYNGKYIYKIAQGASQALLAPEFIEALNSNSPYIMGHTRFATHGAKSNKNAHPFNIGRIVGTHNGIIYNFEQKQTKQNTNFEVDSQIIFNTLNYQGYKGLDNLEGYWGIAWTDIEKPNKFYLSIHNNDIAVLITKDCIYYSSDIQHTEIIKDEGQYYELQENYIYEIDINTLKIKRLDKYSPKEYVPVLSDVKKTTGKYTGNNASYSWEDYCADDIPEDSSILWAETNCDFCGDPIFYGEKMCNYLGGKICMSCKLELESEGEEEKNFSKTYKYMGE